MNTFKGDSPGYIKHSTINLHLSVCCLCMWQTVETTPPPQTVGKVTATVTLPVSSSTQSTS